MGRNIELSCKCGQVQGALRDVSPDVVNRVLCYCDDCQSAAKQIDALPGGHSGVSSDGGTVSKLFRKDTVSCVRGEELLKGHKLRPGSPATRDLATCCNSNMTTRFDNWLPFTAVRTHSVNVESVQPELCINTKFAPDATKPKNPIALARSAVSWNRTMISDSETAEAIAPPTPCTARATTGEISLGQRPTTAGTTARSCSSEMREGEIGRAHV